MKAWTHRARKRFGQHFLHDDTVLERMIAALSPRSGDRVLEIGPGEGALTALLAAEVERLVAVEIDRDLAGTLRQRFPGVEIVEADVLRIDLAALLGAETGWRIVGNLPYNISTPLLIRLFDVADRARDMHFLLQKEVVDRLAARSGTKDFGRLTLMAQLVLDVEPLFDVEPHAFRPPPRVMSTFVRLLPRAAPAVDRAALHDRATFARLVQTGFQQRRKRLSNALQSFAIDWARAPVDAGLRPDAVDLGGWIALANFVAAAERQREG